MDGYVIGGISFASWPAAFTFIFNQLTHMQHTRNIREFVINDFLFGDAAALEDDKSFLDSGILDSTGMLELIMFLEGTYNIKIQPEEMLPENLDSVNRVAAFVERKMAEELTVERAKAEIGHSSGNGRVGEL